MKSKFGGSRCPFCNNIIHKGVEIDKRQGKWGHTICPTVDTPMAVVQPRREFKPSQYQQDIFDFVSSAPGNAVVEAVAGSGKSTTLEHALDYTPRDKSVVYLAFNKRIVDAAKSRMPAHCRVATTHSQAFANVRKSLGNVRVDDRKTWNILEGIKQTASWDERETIEDNVPDIKRLVGLAKNTLQEGEAGLDYLCEHFGITLDGARDIVYRTVNKILDISYTDSGVIDFDDMLWYNAKGKVRQEQFDYLFIDETQDLNAAQIQFMLKSMHSDTRVIAVGDTSQAIYSFRGADSNAMANVSEALDATQLPLSICYRCPQSHIELAQSLVPTIEAREGAPDGILEHLPEAELITKVHPGDMVICRTNAPLVKPAFELIRGGVKAVIIGRDIGTGLVALLRKIGKRASGDSVVSLMSAINTYSDSEVAKLQAAQRNTQAATLLDQCDTLIALAEGCDTVAQIESKITSVFADEVAGVAFSSIHRAKGLESDRVYILKPESTPHRMAKQQWELTQERNLQYISYTRSRSELYFLTEDNK